MAITKTIGSAGGRDFPNVAAWLAAFTPGGWIGECYNDSLFAAGASFSGHSTSSSDFITLRCAAGQGFKDNASAQSNRLAFNQTNGVAIQITANYSEIFTINEDYVTLQGLQISSTTGGQSLCIDQNNNGLPNCVFDGLIIENANGGSEGSIIRSGIISNCLFVMRTSSGVGAIGTAYSSLTFANCTIVRPSNYSTGGNAISGGSSAIALKNCAVFGFSGLVAGGMTTTGSQNNASDIAIGFGSNNQQSLTYANQFVTIADNTGGHDFRLKSGSNLLDTGFTDTADIPGAVDIVGTSRPQGSTWDIGCWELVTSVSYTLTAAVGSFPFSGIAAALKLGRKIAAAVGGIAFSGKVVGLIYARKFVSASGSISFSGQVAALAFGRKVASAGGAFLLSGQAVGLLRTRIFSVAGGAFAFVGQSVTLNKGRLLTAAQGAVAFSGQAASLMATRLISAAQGAISFAGVAVGLFKGRTLTAAQGGFGLSGQAANLLFSRRFVVDLGTIPFTGQIIGLHLGRLLPGSKGSFSYTGQTVILVNARGFLAATGAYPFTGNPASLVATGIKHLASMTLDIAASNATVEISAGDAIATITSSLAIM